MQLIKQLIAAIVAVVEEASKAVTKNIPVVGEATYHTTSMVNDAVKTARREQLIENTKEINRIMKEAELSEADAEAIEAALEY